MCPRQESSSVIRLTADSSEPALAALALRYAKTRASLRASIPAARRAGAVLRGTHVIHVPSAGIEPTSTP